MVPNYNDKIITRVKLRLYYTQHETLRIPLTE